MQYRVGPFLLAAVLLAAFVGGVFQFRVGAMQIDPAAAALAPTAMHPDRHLPPPLIAERLNPRRFTATQILQEGPDVHLQGSVVMKFPSAVVNAEDVQFNHQSGKILIHGDARVRILNVSTQPDGINNQFAGIPATDLRRFGGNEIRQAGTVTHLNGDVFMQLPGVWIEAENADVDSDTATIIIRGDSRYRFLKPAIKPDDQLGPWMNAQ